MKKSLLPLFFGLLLIGCKKETATPEFDRLYIEQVSEKNCNPEEENCAFISLDVPWAEVSGARDRYINSRIEEHVMQLVDFQEEENFGSLESLSQTFIDQYEATAEEFPEYNIPWEASVEGKILYTSPELISMEFHLNLFTGGAHGYTSLSYLNLDPATGERYSNEDLLAAGFKDYSENLFRKRYEIPGEEPINSTGFFFEGDTFHLPQNIGFSKNKVILRYNAYEVASYAEGGIRLEIPRKEVREYLKMDL